MNNLLDTPEPTKNRGQMNNNEPKIIKTFNPEEQRVRLSRVYRLILSWSDTQQANSEPTVTDLGRERTVDPEDSLTQSVTQIANKELVVEEPNGQALSEL